jgi:hypothetical protein
MRFPLFTLLGAALLAPVAAPAQTPTVVTEQPAPPLFSNKERAAIVAYWNAPGHYSLSAPPEAATNGPYVVRLTPEGSTWFPAYQHVVAGAGKSLPPTRDAKPTRGPYAEWEAWVAARLAYDRAAAQQAADAANKAVLKGMAVPENPLPSLTATPAAQLLTPPLPTAPGPIPAGLLAACGNPPAFAGVVAPLQYQVTFDKSDEVFTYTDNVKLRDRYAYYRFHRGTVAYGTRLKDMPTEERDRLFHAAGFSPSEQKIFGAVSGLEGGFETVQTYDTGYVSIGFIQFVTLAEGKHDLSNVLLQEKTDHADDFEKDFRRFGIDVRPDRSLVVLDPATGAELSGNPAVLKIIDDKRLTAVFQRAGRRTPFRVAQIKVAKAYYWPDADPVVATLPDGTAVTGRVGDLVKSEAGLAILLDRKINTGNIRLLSDVLCRCMAAHGCKTIADASLYEKEIVSALKYRADFLADTTLGQPLAPPKPPAAAVATAVAPVVIPASAPSNPNTTTPPESEAQTGTTTLPPPPAPPVTAPPPAPVPKTKP